MGGELVARGSLEDLEAGDVAKVVWALARLHRGGLGWWREVEGKLGELERNAEAWKVAGTGSGGGQGGGDSNISSGAASGEDGV